MRFAAIRASFALLIPVLLLGLSPNTPLWSQATGPAKDPPAPPVATSSLSSVAGRWRSLETSKGGIGVFLDLHPDGTLSFSPGAIVPTTYRTEADKLILPPETTDGPEQVQQFELLGEDKLKITAQGTSLEFTRQGTSRDAAHPLLGEWTAQRDMGGRNLIVHYIFLSDGKFLLLIPFAITPGKYSVKGSAVHFELPDQKPADGVLSPDGNKITIPNSEGGASHFVRY